MLWFYTRDRESLQLETRYDNDTLEYVGILRHGDGRQETKRFKTADDFTAWIKIVERDLMATQWTPDGPPHVLPDGWPDKTPRH